MTAAADGDRTALDPLFAALWPLVVGYARRFLGDAALAEDVAQDALVKLFAPARSVRSRARRADLGAHVRDLGVPHRAPPARTPRRDRATPRRGTSAIVDGARIAEERELVRAALDDARRRCRARDREVIAASLTDDDELRRALAPATFRKRLERALGSPATVLEVSPWHALTLSRCARARTSARTCSPACAASRSPAASSLLAIALHRTTHATWLVAAALAATLATLGWRGGAWRRGALAGVLAGLPRARAGDRVRVRARRALPALPDGADADVHARRASARARSSASSSVTSRRAIRHARRDSRAARSPRRSSRACSAAGRPASAARSASSSACSPALSPVGWCNPHAHACVRYTSRC